MQSTIKHEGLSDTHEVIRWHLNQWNTRLRLTRTATWLPRGILAGVLVALSLGVMSWLRPWLLEETLLRLSIISVSLSIVFTLIAIWLWPRSVDRSAHDFDLRFALKERMTTALEITRGDLAAPRDLVDRQLEDMRLTANNVPIKQLLPLTVRWREMAILFVAILALVLSFVLDNPKAQEVEARQALNQAIDEQIEAVEDLQQQVENNPNLTQEEKDLLNEPLQDARDTLNQEDVSQEEAVAALAEAESRLQEISEGLSAEERSANEKAGNDLSSSPLTNELGRELGDSDLQDAANETRELSDDLSELTPEERNEVADQLDQAAEELEATNPEVAQNMRDAADALREGNTEEAQEALDEAAENLDQQDQANQNSEQSNTAEELARELNEDRQELANQDGQNQEGQESEPNQSSEGQPNQESGQQSGDQQGQPQEGQEGQQPGQGQEGQTGEDPEQSNQAGQQPGEGQEGQQSEGQGGNSENDETSEGGGQGTGNDAAESGQEGAQSTSGENSQPGGSGAGDSGSQEGSEQSSSATSSQNGTADNRPGDTDQRDYDSVFSPTRIGGDGGTEVDLTGKPTDSNGEPLEEGELNDDFSGESRVPYNEVFRQYEQSMRDAFDSDYIPIGMRDIIRSYFSSLEP